MTRLFTLTMAVCCALAPVTARAQEQAHGSEPLSLQRALQETLAHNPSLRAAAASAEGASSLATAARAPLFPRVTFTEGWQRSDQPVFVFSTLLASRQFAASNFAIDQLNYPDSVGYFHGTVGVEQLLFDGGARRAGTESAGAQRTIADLAAREVALGLAANVTDLYGRVLASQAAAKAAAGALATGREDLARATRRRDAGTATEGDVLALAVHVADLEQRVIQANGDATVARAQLNRLMGAPIARTFEAVEPEPPADVTLPNLEALIAQAEAGRPEIQRAAASEQLADSAKRAAHSAVMPHVGAQAAFDLSGTRFNERASAWLVGGELRWTFSTSGAEKAQMQAATSAAARARAEAEDVRGQIQVDVVTAVQQVHSARARQAVGRAAVAQARESQRIIRDRYEAGLVPVNDVLRAASAVLDADTQRVSALVDALVGQARLDRALGRLPNATSIPDRNN